MRSSFCSLVIFERTSNDRQPLAFIDYQSDLGDARADSHPKNFSGLHLFSIMYAAFQQFAPNDDVGIDLSEEYKAAVETENYS